jgi:hypothetical protein
MQAVAFIKLRSEGIGTMYGHHNLERYTFPAIAVTAFALIIEIVASPLWR